MLPLGKMHSRAKSRSCDNYLCIKVRAWNVFNYRISVTLWKFLHMLELCFAFFFFSHFIACVFLYYGGRCFWCHCSEMADILTCRCVVKTQQEAFHACIVLEEKGGRHERWSGLCYCSICTYIQRLISPLREYNMDLFVCSALFTLKGDEFLLHGLSVSLLLLCSCKRWAF